MTTFDYTEREILWGIAANTRSEAIVALKKEMPHIGEPLMAETVEGLLRKLIQMTEAEFTAADKQRPDWE